MKILTFIIALIISQTICLGQDNDLPMREAFKLQMAVDTVNFYEVDIDPGKYVLPDNTIQLYPGEEIFVELELDKNSIKSVKTVKQIVNPEKTMTISFSQQIAQRHDA